MELRLFDSLDSIAAADWDALHDGSKMYVLSDQQTPEKFAAQKVKVTGTLYPKTRIIKVDKIEAAK